MQGQYSSIPLTRKCFGLQVLLSVVSLAVGSPLGTVTTQYHAQDELGQYSYGYSGGPSAKHETRTLDGVTRGGGQNEIIAQSPNLTVPLY